MTTFIHQECSTKSVGSCIVRNWVSHCFSVGAYRKDAEVLIEESHFAVQSEWVTLAPLTSVSTMSLYLFHVHH